ncbi:MAG: hypothetical protein J6O23_11370 [Prevotella sp.]|nr:hypothetical protein [Prevotella sp.]
MPRKKDGMLFEVHPTPAKGRDGRNIVYARPASGRKITFAQLDAYCAEHYGLRQFELERAFHAFLEATGYFLAEGYRVETPIGSFVARLALDGVFTDPDAVEAKHVRLDNVDYNPGQQWNRQMRKWNRGFRRVDRPNSQELLANQEFLENVLRQALESFHGFVTVGIFSHRSGLTMYSARKQLNRWTEGEKPKLLKTRRGKEDIYTEI